MPSARRGSIPLFHAAGMNVYLCGQPFDTFQTGAVCPHCASQFPLTMCLDCRGSYPMSEWSAYARVPSSV